MRSKTTTREFDAEGRMVKETVVEQDAAIPADAVVVKLLERILRAVERDQGNAHRVITTRPIVTSSGYTSPQRT